MTTRQVTATECTCQQCGRVWIARSANPTRCPNHSCPNPRRWQHERRGRRELAPCMLTHDGRTMSIYAWSKALGINRNVLYWRRKHGWSVERMLTTTEPTP